MKLRHIGFGLALGAALLVTGASPAGNQSAWPPRVRVVYLPFNGVAETLRRFSPLTEHLGRALGVPVTAYCSEDYEQIYAVLSRGEFELAYLSPATYLVARKRAKLEVAAKEMYGAERGWYYSLLIAKRGRYLSGAADDGVFTLAFANPSSTSGYLLPRLYLRNVLHLEPESLGQVVMAGNHDLVIRGVFEGRYDLGATSDVDIERMVKQGLIPAGAFSVAWQSDPIPGAPLCLRSNLPAGFKTKLREAVFALNQNREAMEAMALEGFGPAAAEDYRILEMVGKLAND